MFVTDNNVIPGNNITLLNDNDSNDKLNSVYFNSVDVFNQIKKLKSNSAPGWDGISANLLKKLITEICFPLSIISNVSISSGEAPNAWKRAIVIPVFKNV